MFKYFFQHWKSKLMWYYWYTSSVIAFYTLYFKYDKISVVLPNCVSYFTNTVVTLKFTRRRRDKTEVRLIVIGE